jgi:hypothetical protein
MTDPVQAITSHLAVNDANAAIEFGHSWSFAHALPANASR